MPVLRARTARSDISEAISMIGRDKPKRYAPSFDRCNARNRSRCSTNPMIFLLS